MNSASLSPAVLLCEYEPNPLGLDVKKPRFSWKLQARDGVRGAAQSAYRVVAAAAEDDLSRLENLLWDSGRIESDASHLVEYSGKALSSRQRVFWKVQVWDESGIESPWSETSWFESGFLRAEDWQAQWIGAPDDGDNPAALASWQTVEREQWESHWHDLQENAIAQMKPSPHLRRAFDITKKVARARVYVSARGLYELHINGQRVGDDYFTPGWTEYARHLQYQTYDVTALLQNGANAMGAILADGWYRGGMGWEVLRDIWGSNRELLLQLHVTYEDGSEDVIISDADWKTATGAIEYSDFLMGEHYDARRELTGWSRGDYDDSAWQSVKIYSHDNSILAAQCGPPVRVLEELPAQSVREVQPGVWVFDLGQNFSGVVKLRVLNAQAGQEFRLRHAEVLNPDGSLYITNLRAARAVNFYVARGDAEEIYQPRFTFHGFRYVEVSGFTAPPELEAVTGIVLGSDTPPAGSWRCDNAMLNQLQSNIVWGQRGNFLEVPTDCPQRDERLGWMADAQVFCRTASYNAQVAGFFTRWMRVVRDSQGEDGNFPNVAPRIPSMNGTGAPAWGDAGVIIPWTLYRVYGDVRVLSENYDAMKAWIDYLDRENPDGTWMNARGFDFGDWLSIAADTDKDMMATACWAYSTGLVADAARVLGNAEDAEKYDALRAKIVAAFNATFVEENGRIRGDTQTAYVLAWMWNLVPQHLRPVIAGYLADDIAAKGNHLSTGFVGVSLLMPMLSEAGRDDLTNILLLNETFPSWGYSVKHGATTIWERWDGWTHDNGFQDIGMNSFNHYSLGSVGEWMYRYAAGLDMAEIGFKVLKMQPRFIAGLSHVAATYETPYGLAKSAWKKDGARLQWNVRVPPNSRAQVVLPLAEYSENGASLENAGGLSAIVRDEQTISFALASGDYVFQKEG